MILLLPHTVWGLSCQDNCLNPHLSCRWVRWPFFWDGDYHYFIANITYWVTAPSQDHRPCALLSGVSPRIGGCRVRFCQHEICVGRNEWPWGPQIEVYLIEGSLEVKLPTIWTDGKAEVGRARKEKSRREKIREEKEWEERRCRCAKR